MKTEEKNISNKSYGSTIFHVIAVVVALIGIALLVNNALYYTRMVNQYVAQGYQASDVIKQLLPSQLLPGIFEPIAVYGGISSILYGTGKIYKKISKCLIPIPNPEYHNDFAIDNINKDKDSTVNDIELPEPEEKDDNPSDNNL